MEWKNIKGYEGLYEICDTNGLVRNIKRDKILKSGITNDGYEQVKLSKHNERKSYLVHRLVCLTFLENPDNKLCVNHIDSNRTNNNLSNLEFCTHSENIQHMIKQGRRFDTNAENNSNVKLTWKEVNEIRESNLKNVKLAVIYNICPSHISAIRNYKAWIL